MAAISKLSELAPECSICEHVNDCDEKRMVACAYLQRPQILSPVLADLTAPLTEDILVKHDYRDIKIGENTTVTIDLEDLKRQLEKDFYKHLNCQFGA